MSDNADSYKVERNRVNEIELRRATRRQRAIERLGTRNPKCAHCGEADPLALELHHIAGQAYDRATVIVCRNCHRKLSDLQKDHPAKIAKYTSGRAGGRCTFSPRSSGLF